MALLSALVVVALVPGGSGAGAQPVPSSQASGVAVADAGRATFEPAVISRITGTQAVMVLGTNTCNGRLCAQLWRVSAGGRDIVELAAPPGVTAVRPGIIDGPGALVFANSEDGYALPALESGGQAYYTSDGAKTWRHLPAPLAPSLVGVVVAGGHFYGLIYTCTTTKGVKHCSYRLGRSSLGTPAWSSVAIPGAGGVEEGSASIAATGDVIWTYLEPQKAGAEPVILKTGKKLLHFSKLAEPALVSVATCDMALMTTSTAWVSCPTGMMVSWLRTTDGGHHFTHWWETSGTGGDAFDPLSATVAYRYTGEVGPGAPRTLGLTTNGGKSFVPVAHLSLSGGSQGELAFVSEQDGYALSPAGGAAGAERSALRYSSDGGREWQVVFGA